MRFNNNVHRAAIFICIVMAWVTTVQSAEVITSDTTWHGEREISGDLIIPDGVTLTISGGSEVRMTNKQDPGEPGGVVTHLPRILVQGHLEAEGDSGSPVIFSAAKHRGTNRWAGIVVDDGNAWLHETRIQDAETGVYVKKGWVKLKKSILTNNCCGVVITGSSSGTKIEKSTLTENEFGLILDDDSVVSILDSTFHGNREKDILSNHTVDDTGMKTVCSCDLIHDKNREGQAD